MKKIIYLVCLFFVLIHTNVYGINKKVNYHYDKADIKNRTYGQNFKDYALISCLMNAEEKLNRPLNKDLQWSISGYLQEWIDFDLDNIKKTKYILNEINLLSKKYIDNAGGLQANPKATIYTFGCLNFYHSDDLDKLMKQFVLHSNMTFRQNYPNQ